MPWTKDRPRSPGELEFHLPGERSAPKPHDKDWLEERAAKLARHHKHE